MNALITDHYETQWNKRYQKICLVERLFNNALMLAVLKTSILEASQEMNLQIIKENNQFPNIYRADIKQTVVCVHVL